MATKRTTVLATAFFDGRPVRGPIQSFAAANTSTSAPGSTDALIKKLHGERQKREDERRRIQAVLKIQRFWRRHKVWKEMKSGHRRKFDDEIDKEKNRNETEIQMRRLLLFFVPKMDGDRLVRLCQQVVKSINNGERYSSSLVQLFLQSCIRYLKYAAKDQSINIAMPFRCLEVVLLNDRFANTLERMEKINLLDRVIRHGYFEVLRDLFDHRTPSADLVSETTKAPVPQAESFMKAAIRPLAILQSSRRILREEGKDVSGAISNAWFSFVSSFLAKTPMSPIVRFYVLPAFAGQVDLVSLNSLAEYVANRSGVTLKVDGKCCSAEFAYSLSYLASKRGLSCSDHKFIQVYADASNCLLELASQSTPDLEDEYDDRGVPMEVDEHGVDRRWVLDEWMKLNHQEGVVACLTQIAESESNTENSASLTSLIELCRIHWSTELAGGQHCRFLHMLAYHPKLIGQLWHSIVTSTTPSIFGPPRRLIDQLQTGSALSVEDRRRLVPLLSVFCALFSTTLAAANDDDFFHDLNLKPSSSTVPFSRPALALLSALLRDVALGLIKLALPDSRATVSEQYRDALTTMGADFSKQDTTEWNQLFESVVRLLQLLHDRDERLQFCAIGSWSVADRITLQHVRMFRSNHPHSRRRRRLFNTHRYLTRQELEDEKSFVQSSAELRNMTILRKMPFVVPFEQRVELLYELISNDQIEHAGRVQGMWQEGRTVNARRNFLYEDALDQLSPANVPNLRQKIRVRLQNWAGAVEAGIDGGGLFREFLNELLKTGFDPQRGFFVSTSHDSTLYPNPMAPILFPQGGYRHHYVFLGRMVAKLIYENQLAELRFSRFFLARLLRSSNEVDVHQLVYYDPLLYKNLSRLANEEDVSALNLDFSITVEQLGQISTVELKQNGAQIPVTNANRLEYIQLVADYYMNRQIQGQTDAFREGLSHLIDLDWLQMFDYRELQVLISGADRDIDVSDLQMNAGYYGDIHKEGGEVADPYIQQFWTIVHGFNEEQKKKLLKFVTSCSRPPLLGFKDLHPQFTVQIVNLRQGEQDRLPTAATCLNLLKLPRFPDAKLLKEKLLYAIESSTGFELS